MYEDAQNSFVCFEKISERLITETPLEGLFRLSFGTSWIHTHSEHVPTIENCRIDANKFRWGLQKLYFSQTFLRVFFFHHCSYFHGYLHQKDFTSTLQRSWAYWRWNSKNRAIRRFYYLQHWQLELHKLIALRQKNAYLLKKSKKILVTRLQVSVYTHGNDYYSVWKMELEQLRSAKHKLKYLREIRKYKIWT